MVSNLDTVLDKWKCDFQSLLNNPDDNVHNTVEYNGFTHNILHQKSVREEEMEHNDYEENPELNRPLSFDEIEKMVMKLKNDKAAGIDSIPNEVLKLEVKLLNADVHIHSKVCHFCSKFNSLI